MHPGHHPSLRVPTIERDQGFHLKSEMMSMISSFSIWTTNMRRSSLKDDEHLSRNSKTSTFVRWHGLTCEFLAVTRIKRTDRLSFHEPSKNVQVSALPI
jgi:hypothetical protein